MAHVLAVLAYTQSEVVFLGLNSSFFSHSNSFSQGVHNCGLSFGAWANLSSQALKTRPAMTSECVCVYIDPLLVNKEQPYQLSKYSSKKYNQLEQKMTFSGTVNKLQPQGFYFLSLFT